MHINIAGKSKSAVLRALFNHSRQQGLGFLNREGAADMTEEDASRIVSELVSSGQRLSVDYLRGRVLKVDLTDDTFDPCLYDRDNGSGAAARAIEEIEH